MSQTSDPAINHEKLHYESSVLFIMSDSAGAQRSQQVKIRERLKTELKQCQTVAWTGKLKDQLT